MTKKKKEYSPEQKRAAAMAIQARLDEAVTEPLDMVKIALAVKKKPAYTTDKFVENFANIMYLYHSDNEREHHEGEIYLLVMFEEDIRRYVNSMYWNVFKTIPYEKEEFYQIARIAFVNALPTYCIGMTVESCGKESEFNPMTYFESYIRKSVSAHYIHHILNLSQHYATAYAKIMRAQDTLVKKKKDPNNLTLIHEYTALFTPDKKPVPMTTIKKVLEIVGRTPYPDFGKDAETREFLEDELFYAGYYTTPDEEYEKTQFEEDVNRAIDEMLTKEEAGIIRYMEGFIDGNVHTEAETARVIDMKPAKVHTIYENALRKLSISVISKYNNFDGAPLFVKKALRDYEGVYQNSTGVDNIEVA